MRAFSSVLAVLVLVCYLCYSASGQIQCDSPSQDSSTTDYRVGNGTLFFQLYRSAVCEDAGSYSGGSDTFDDAIALKINDHFVQNYTSFNETGNSTDPSVVRDIYVTFQPTVEGIIVSRKVHFPANAPWGRWLEILTNPTNQDIDVDFTLMGESGHDSGDRVWATSTYPNGTTPLPIPWVPSDYFVCFDDATDPGSDEPDCFAYAWAGGLSPYYVNITTAACYGPTSTTSGYDVKFQFTVPAGATRIIMEAWAIGYDRAELISHGQSLGSFPSYLLEGISDAERCQIVNAPPCTATSTTSTTTTGASTSSSAQRNLPLFGLF